MFNASRALKRARRASAALGVTLAIAGLCFTVPASAGQTCEENKPTATTVYRALTLAQRVNEKLESSGAEVALIARAGQDLTKYGLRYSHLGFVVRDHPDGPWTVVHELNECATADSALFTQGLGTFFLDDMFRYESLIVIPEPRIQQRLRGLLLGRAFVRMHEAHYSVVAYPFSTRYQNSNQWALELLAVASAEEGQIATRAEAQAWLRDAGFVPTTLQIDAMQRLGARMFKANVAFDDHPFDRRMAGQIDCVTVESIAAFVAEREAGSRALTVGL
ncbi:MAG: DUF2145 domain-containing protein [Burkholderiaceae bacterium]